MRQTRPISLGFGNPRTGSHISKTCREADVPHPRGNYTLLKSRDEIATAVLELWESIDCQLTRAMLKLNEGLSGLGNAMFTLPKGLKGIPDRQDRHRVLAATMGMEEWMQPADGAIRWGEGVSG